MPSPEETTLKKIARQYSTEGYEVVVSPSPSQLPESLRDFSIDLLAKRGDETVVVQVKKPTSRKPERQLQILAEAVNKIPNYSFDFIAVAQPAKPGRTEWLLGEELRKRMNEAIQLSHMGFPEASTLLLWSATEGALRLLSAHQHVATRAESPSLIIKNLYSQGILNKDEYIILERAVRFRNAAVHGYRTEELDKSFFHRWVELTTSLLGRV